MMMGVMIVQRSAAHYRTVASPILLVQGFPVRRPRSTWYKGVGSISPAHSCIARRATDFWRKQHPSKSANLDCRILCAAEPPSFKLIISAKGFTDRPGDVRSASRIWHAFETSPPAPDPPCALAKINLHFLRQHLLLLSACIVLSGLSSLLCSTSVAMHNAQNT